MSMKKFLFIILTALTVLTMFTACNNQNDDTEVEDSPSTYSETTVLKSKSEQETIMTSKENTETSVETEETTKTETEIENNSLTVLSEDDLSSDAKVFLKFVNSYRQKEGAEDVVPVKELNECAKKYVGEISNNFFAFSGGTRDDGSDFSTLLDEAGITYTLFDQVSGMTVYYDVSLVLNNIPYSKISITKWKYMGFYYDSEELFWSAIFISDDPADAPIPKTDTSDPDAVQNVSSYYDDTSEFDALNTYMNALCNDDYSTYLAITRQEDNDDVSDEYKKCKKIYEGMSPSDIEYYEVGEGFGLGGYGTYYNVVEYDSDGNAKFDINTFGDACGTIVISGSSNSYYVALHHRYSPYVSIDKLAN